MFSPSFPSILPFFSSLHWPITTAGCLIISIIIITIIIITIIIIITVIIIIIIIFITVYTRFDGVLVILNR